MGAVADREAEQERIRVLVADDHVLYRRGLQMVLGLESTIEIIGEASDGEEATRLAGELAPDVVLLDVFMPRRTGIEACAAIRELVPDARILMLTMSDEERDLFEAISAGAHGYVLKDVPADEVADAIIRVHAGESLIPQALAPRLLAEFASLTRQGPQTPNPHLTARELEVIKLLAHGKSNREIARVLVISENTVKNHVRNILDKLQLHSRTEAALYAMRERLVEGT